MIDRRAVLAVLAGSLLLDAPPSRAQPGTRIPRIGFVEAGAASANQHFLDSFEMGMRELGYVNGTSVIIDARWAEGRADRFPELLGELGKLKPDVMVVASTLGAASVCERASGAKATRTARTSAFMPRVHTSRNAA